MRYISRLHSSPHLSLLRPSQEALHPDAGNTVLLINSWTCLQSYCMFYTSFIGSAQADPTVIPGLRGNHSDHPPQRGRRPRNIVTVYTPCLHACFWEKFCHNFGANGLKRLHLDKSLNKIFTISTFLGTLLHKICPNVVLICMGLY